MYCLFPSFNNFLKRRNYSSISQSDQLRIPIDLQSPTNEEIAKTHENKTNPKLVFHISLPIYYCSLVAAPQVSDGQYIALQRFS
mmetsp:Transcript_23106/g.48737  ORF Transcript_23106/g.48737 Transcript_23106/m.48737 type:complete len:84 (+) Transcript_23106:352-603(+)